MDGVLALLMTLFLTVGFALAAVGYGQDSRPISQERDGR
jgi:hypothetical protein